MVEVVALVVVEAMQRVQQAELLVVRRVPEIGKSAMSKLAQSAVPVQQRMEQWVRYPLDQIYRFLTIVVAAVAVPVEQQVLITGRIMLQNIEKKIKS